jgi:hypothetical protein
MNTEHRTLNIEFPIVKIKRCKHGFVEGQCYVCKTGPVGFIDEQDTTRDNKVDRLELLKKIGSRINRERREIREQNILAQCLVPVEDSVALCPEREDKKMAEVKTKVCRKCEKAKTLTKENYNPNKLCKDGFEGTCKQCKADRGKERRKEKKAEGSKLEFNGIVESSKLKAKREDPPDSKYITLENQITDMGSVKYDLKAISIKESDQDHRFVGEAYKPFDLSAVIAEYPEVLEKVTDLAKEEMRSVAMQALWLIRAGLAKEELGV